jgi:hypothetical protein
MQAFRAEPAVIDPVDLSSAHADDAMPLTPMSRAQSAEHKTHDVAPIGQALR